ncbi:dNA polymerase III subunits gamma and tau [Clostridium sp. CAG:411]|jgi:DNA polymerase-3 subunit gamma/tau|nr:DNA polymerase III subunit gamma/tau [Lachnospiraceae bacterium]CDE42307.1 dNA polymerase III subunits gamma and tau [Clostridium sp. CAG:411]
MSYTALYRKFRPTEFEDVKGQEHIVRTLRNQIRAGRIGHAFLFCGTRGTGKTTIAKILAKAVNCEHPIDGSPCNTCGTCKAINEQTSMNVIEMDAASNNGVDNIREIVEDVQYSPAQGKYKVYIIDEVHMLSTGAFNALLKTLEEPPEYVIFILATTEAHKIPITILSRCQRYDFRRITIDVIADRLKELLIKEEVQAEEKAIRYIAKAGDGSMRDALSLLDRCIAFYLGEELTYDKVLEVLGAVDTDIFSALFQYVAEGNVSGCMEILEELITRGRELTQVVMDFTWYLRNLLLVKTSKQAREVVDVSSEHFPVMEKEAEMVEADTLMRYIRVLSELSNQIRYATQKRVLIEVALIKLCKPAMETNYDSILDRIRVLEKQVEKGVVVKQQPAVEQVVSVSQQSVEKQKEPETIEALEKAIPEELQAVAKNWDRICASIPPSTRAYLANAIPSVGEGNSLLLLFEDDVARGMFDTEEHIKEVTSAIEQQLHKEVQVHAKYMKNQGKNQEDILDLSRFSKMTIEIEE